MIRVWLLDRGQGACLGREIALGLRECGLQRALLAGERFAPGQRGGKLVLALARLGVDRRDLCVEAREQLGDLRGLLRQPPFALAGELQLLLKPRDFGVGSVERALFLVQQVARAILIGAQALHAVLRRAQLRLQRFETGGEVRDFGGMLFALSRRILLLGEPQQMLRLLQAGFALAIPGRNLGLRFELRELRGELAPDVLDPRQVIPTVAEAAFRLFAPFPVFGDARRLFEEHAQLLGSGLDHAGDHALLDDRIGTRSQAGAQEQVVDIAAADGDIVDVIRRIAVARQHALDRQLGVAAPLAADPALAVVEKQLDRSAPDRRALARAVEDDILHRFAAQRRRLGFAEHPAHGVDDVRFAAAVGADDAGQPRLDHELGRLHEGLEAQQPQPIDVHDDEYLA